MRRYISLITAAALLMGCLALGGSALAGEASAPGDAAMAGLSDVQRNSVGVLNYLAYLTREIESRKRNRLYLEEAYASLYNNTHMNAIDAVTLGQVKSLLTTLNGFKMISGKRERLEYIRQQELAQAIFNAMPDPSDVIKMAKHVESWQMALAAVVYLGIHSALDYYNSVSTASLEYLQGGWELDDEEAELLHQGRLESLEYLWEIVHDYDLPAELAISGDDIDRFVEWKNNGNLVARIQFLESNREVYQAFGEYWLTLAESRYDHGDMSQCLEAVRAYETCGARIFRRDYHNAKVLPMAIAAASEVCDADQYAAEASRFAAGILSNCDQEDWALRCFAAMTYLDLAGRTSDDAYLRAAYDIALNNVNYLAQKQLANNRAYLAEVRQEPVPQGTAAEKKKEIEAYNRGVAEARRTALPPVSDALLINCDLLFSLAEQMGVSEDERARIDGILHGGGEALFLNPLIDGLYRADGSTGVSADGIEAFFDGKEIRLPARFLSESAVVSVGGLNADGSVFAIDDWTVKSVERGNASDIDTFTATYTSGTAADFAYSDGSTVWINLNPLGSDHTKSIQLTYAVRSIRELLKRRLSFERIG